MRTLAALLAVVVTFGFNVSAQSPKDSARNAGYQAKDETVVLSVRGMT
jgi:hypothetical protein